MKIKLKELSMITIMAGILIAFFGFILFGSNPALFAMTGTLAAMVAAGIPLMYRYEHYSKIKKIEIMFPRFLSDVTKNINTGMTLPQSMRSVCTNDYGLLTPHVKEMSAKISWGISFEKVLIEFSKKIGSKNLKRTVWTIIEAHRSGGTINTVLEAVSESLKEVEKIRKERSSSIYSQMITGYMIYLIFLFVVILMSRFLIPSFQLENKSNIELMFKDLFRNMAIIQGVFAGLAIGKMAEGTLLAGVKHALVLTAIGMSTFLIFIG